MTGGVDFSRTPRQNVSRKDFRARWPKLADRARRSLERPAADTSGEVWLGAGDRAPTQPRIRNERGARRAPGARRMQMRASARADAGGTVRFALRLSNRSDARLRGIEVCDDLPAGLVFVRSNRAHRVRGGRHCWDLPRLGSGRSATIRLTARVAAGTHGALRNEATASVDGAPALGVRVRQTVRAGGRAQPAPPGGVAG